MADIKKSNGKTGKTAEFQSVKESESGQAKPESVSIIRKAIEGLKKGAASMRDKVFY
ncbi:MAG: hypothetical protein HPY53_01165 [Brevinematales bacterium]|nr:hypothetical protein [Brevinematales bacterium]